MKRRNMALAAAAALIAAAGGWYWASPWWTLWRMREAARARDVAALASYIDRAAVAARSKARARAFWRSVPTAPRGGTESPRFVELARSRLAEIERDPGVGPADLFDWLVAIPVRRGGLGAYRTRDYDPVVIRHGFDRFELRERGASLKYGPLLTFRRHGLGWKLEDARWGQQ